MHALLASHARHVAIAACPDKSFGVSHSVCMGIRQNVLPIRCVFLGIEDPCPRLPRSAERDKCLCGVADWGRGRTGVIPALPLQPLLGCIVLFSAIFADGHFVMGVQ